jgi:diguanylate cyclase (GGDEF)-like protein
VGAASVKRSEGSKIVADRPTTWVMAALRRSPVALFSAVSLVSITVLTVVLGYMLQGRIADRALESAAATSGVIGELAVRRYVTPRELRTKLSKASVAELDEHLQSRELRAIGIQKVKVFDTRRALVYSNDGTGVGDVAPPKSSVGRALAGQHIKSISRGTADTGRGGQTLSVYAPLTYPGQALPAGAFEVYLDYGPTAAAVGRDALTMWALVAGALALLWFALFRLVRRVSQALHRQVDENRHQATHDGLTDLPNRTLLFERVEDAASAGPAALLQLDLDGFREINDTLGHDHGDELLVEVAGRLRAATGPDDLVARLGGDEFAVLRRGTQTEDDAVALAEHLVDALRAPHDVRGTTIVIDATVGIALAPQHGDDASTLARRAEVAMYQAKRRHAGASVYDADADHHHRGRLELLGELGAAIRSGELRIAYQPKIDLASGDVHGVEALVRWQHPEQGLLYPGAFIPAAEVTSLIRPLTLHVIDAALAAQRRWAAQGLELTVAVNLAGPCVMDDTIPRAVADLLADHDVAPEMLTLEISERTMMSDLAGALRVLEALRALGVRLSLDDFGTGQTSLGQLRQLPLHEMKVDRSLVIGDERLMTSVVEIAHKFGLRAVGEGVETIDVADALLAAGCDEAQGFLWARPMWPEDLPAWVADRSAVSAA